MLTVRLWLRDGWLRRTAVTIGLLDLVFIVGMVVFIHYWAEIDRFGPAGHTFIRYVLVQFHLGTENVVAAWYSSMLLLAVGAASCAAFAIERRTARSGLDRWLGLGWLVFAAIFTLLSLDEIGSFHERIGMMVALNKASLEPSATGPVGWVYMLAIPICLVGAFMLAFGWMRLRRVPAAFVLLAIGVGLYLSDPLLEALEAVLVRSGSPRIVVERVLEEGVAELGGTLCFLLGVLIYCSRTAGTRPIEWSVNRRIATMTILVAGALMTIGVPISHWVVSRLPPGDTGIPDNWFPAAALAVLALIAILVYGRGAVPAAAACVAASAYFGAGLYVYASWFPLVGQRGVLVDIAATFLVTMAAAWVTLRSRRSARVPIRSVPSP
jgi:hypothetical protein